MFEQALETLLAEKDFDKISVSDIAETANLTRATFYAHFVDKFSLLEGLVATRFRALLEHREVVFDGTCPMAMHNIALAVCDFLVAPPYCTEQRQLAQSMELALVEIVRALLGKGLARHPPRSGVDPDLVAAMLAGAIYGAARQWVRTADRPPAEEAAATVTTLLIPIMMAGRDAPPYLPAAEGHPAGLPLAG